MHVGDYNTYHLLISSAQWNLHILAIRPSHVCIINGSELRMLPCISLNGQS